MEQRNAPVVVTVALTLAAVVLVVVGIVYFAQTAHALPAFFPGHVSAATGAEATHHHTKHGIAAVGLAVMLAAGAWLSAGTRRPTTPGSGATAAA